MRTGIKTLLIVLALAVPALADGFTFAVTRVDLICDGPEGPRLALTIDKTANVASTVECDNDRKCIEDRDKLEKWMKETIREPKNYRLFDLESEKFATIGSLIDPINPEFNNVITFHVSNYDLAKYALLVRDTEYGGEKDDGTFTPMVVKVGTNPTCKPMPSSVPQLDVPQREDQKTPKFNDYFAKPPDDGIPQLQMDFSMQGSKKKKVLYNFVTKFRPYTRHRVGFGGHYDLTPFFLETEYRINADPTDKKNVLNIGGDFTWTRIIRDDGDEDSNVFTRHVPGFVVSLTPKLETEWGLRSRNIVFAPRITLPINLYQSRSATVRIDPFVGYELGVIWASPTAKPGAQLARPLFGATAVGNFFRKDDKPLFAVQLDYIRRILMKPEVAYGPDPNANDELVPDRASKRPRDDVKAKFTINATKLFSPFIEYEYGRVPPQYNLVKHSFRTGIAFNVDVVWKSFN